jgi:thioredoxin
VTWITDGGEFAYQSESAMNKPIRVTASDFEVTVLQSKEPVIVDFYADWCGPCKMLSPVLEQIASDRHDVKVAKVNVDEEPALAERYRILSIPYVARFEGGKLLNHVVGYQTRAALEAKLGLAS